MRIRNFIFICLILSLFQLADLNAQTGAAKGRGRLKGKVTDAQGKPVEGITVHFANKERGATFDLKTNNKGEWTANGIAGGSWDIDFSKEGFETKSISYGVSEGFNKPIEISLQPGQAAPAGSSTSGAPAAAGKEAAKPDPARQLIMEGNDLADQKNYDGAIAKYQEAMKLNPTFYTLWGDIGNLYNRAGQYDKALEAYNMLLSKEPTNIQARIDATMVLFQKKDIPAAKKMLEELEPGKIDDANTAYNIGANLYNAQQTDLAIKYWERCIQIDPKMTDAYVQLGSAYLSIKQNDKAKQMFQKVIELDPNSDSAKMAQEMLNSMQ